MEIDNPNVATGDDADKASYLIELQTQTALASQRAAAMPQKEQCKDDGTIVCCECFEPMNPARLKAIPTASSCVECLEAMGK